MTVRGRMPAGIRKLDAMLMRMTAIF